jgi:membrane fusion protein (multidrug efflux system)
MLNMKIRTCTFLATLLAGSLIAGCTEQAPEISTTKIPVEVDMITLKAEPFLLEVELSGRTAAYRVAEVRPQVNGIVTKRLFAEGSEVKAGEILYQIDAASYQARLDSARATLAKANAAENLAKLKAKRYRKLIRTNAISELDQLEIEAIWQQAVADVALAEAALDSARIDLEYTRVTAPISGRIGTSMISEGALVTAQQGTPLAIIQQLDPLYVDVTQSSSELLRLKKNIAAGLIQGGEKNNSAVTILLEDGSAYEHVGSLEFSDVTVDQSTGTVTLRALVDNPDEALLPGMFVRARVAAGVRQDAILVPAESISRNSKGEAVVMLVNEQSTVESRIISSGMNIGNRVMVDKGLVAGEQLITAGFQKIKPGAVVKGVQPQGLLPTELALRDKSLTSVIKAE